MNAEKKYPAIAMDAVESSQIAAIGHDPETNTLAIQFHSRKDGTPSSVYHYSNFTSDDFAAFKDAESIGSHFGKAIKPFSDRFPFMKIPAAVQTVEQCGKISDGHACTMPKGSECPDCCGIRGGDIPQEV